MPLRETDKGVEPRKKKSDKRYVKQGTYTRLVDEFIDSNMDEAEVTLDESDLREEVDGAPPKILYNGLRQSISKREIDGVAAVMDSGTIYLVKTEPSGRSKRSFLGVKI